MYINGVSCYEATSREDLYSDETRYVGINSNWGFDDGRVQYPERTLYRWLAEVDDENTTIFVNFRQLDPNAETVEVNVRPCCFYPRETGVHFITLRGFEIAQAASPWAPPTAHQMGMVGPHWSKGWIIENNDIHDAKCNGISLGKEAATGHNLASRFQRKSGHRHQLEAVFHAVRRGWNREQVGSHLVRGNRIHDCGQTGIVGHMGCAFSRIEDNHIFNIGLKREFWGHEMGGIKFHAAIDTVIEHNHIHHCTLGTWLDWQDQGARITRNLYHDNLRDLMVEVSHGPCLVDNNICFDRYALDNWAQGTAFVHNLFLGNVVLMPVLERTTPYHFSHSTAVAGYSEIYGGDDRVYNNLFVGKWEPGAARNLVSFGEGYDKYSSPEEYTAGIAAARHLELGRPQYVSLTTYRNIPQPIWMEHNVYSGWAKPARFETGSLRAEGIAASLEEKEGKWLLTLDLPREAAEIPCRAVTTERLGMPRLSELPFENPDGSPLDTNRDFFGNVRGEQSVPGPFANAVAGRATFVVWEE